MKKIKKSNHTSSAVSDAKSAKQITYDGGKAMMVGGSEKNQSIAGLKNLVPDLKKK